MTNTYAIGVDLGGTKLAVGTVDGSGVVREKIITPTLVEAGPNGIKDQIVQSIRELIKQKAQNPIAIGVGLPGQVDAKNGTVLFAPNLQWKEVPIQQMLERDLKLPVAVTNDVRAATWGEWTYGAGRECQDLVSIFVGTGIGAGIVSQGKMLTGDTNCAGEIGHMVIHTGGKRCRCGQNGCFEAYASGWAIASRAKEIIKKDPQSGKAVLNLVHGDLEKITAREVAASYKLGDLVATQIIEEVIQALIAGSTNIVTIINPRRVIFGGGVIKEMPELIEPVRQGILCQALTTATRNLEIHPAGLTTDAGVIGAAVFARQYSTPSHKF